MLFPFPYQLREIWTKGRLGWQTDRWTGGHCLTMRCFMVKQGRMHFRLLGTACSAHLMVHARGTAGLFPSFLLIFRSTIFRCVHASLYVRLSVRPSVHPSIRQSVRPSVYSSVSLSIRPSVCPSVACFMEPRNLGWNCIKLLKKSSYGCNNAPVMHLQ